MKQNGKKAQKKERNKKNRKEWESWGSKRKAPLFMFNVVWKGTLGKQG